MKLQQHLSYEFQDSHRLFSVWYVNSIQIHSRKLADRELVALGTPTAEGLPLSSGAEPEPDPEPELTVNIQSGNLTISWPSSFSGLTLESSPTLNNAVWTIVPGVSNNSATVPTTGPQLFFRLRR